MKKKRVSHWNRRISKKKKSMNTIDSGLVAINIQSTGNLRKLRRYDSLRLDDDWSWYLISDYEKNPTIPQHGIW